MHVAVNICTQWFFFSRSMRNIFCAWLRCSFKKKKKKKTLIILFLFHFLQNLTTYSEPSPQARAPARSVCVCPDSEQVECAHAHSLHHSSQGNLISVLGKQKEKPAGGNGLSLLEAGWWSLFVALLDTDSFSFSLLTGSVYFWLVIF